MPVVDSDIPWAVLRQIVRDWAGSDADLREFRPLAGGSVNTTLCLTLADGRRTVLKITPHRVERRYADEADQLALLRKAGVPVPDVLAVHVGSLDSPYSYLMLEHVDGVDWHSAKRHCSADQFDSLQRQLAETLLRLHAVTGTHHGRASRQDPPCDASWPDCYRNWFDPIWAEVEKSTALPVKLRKAVGKLHARLDSFLTCDGPPRLLHWDVWSGNLLARHDDAGQWHLAAMLDPNCRYGSIEAELAYVDLFHTSTPAFLKTYQHGRKLAAGYHEVRKPIYQLYGMMNHVSMHGGQHAAALRAQAERVANLV